MYRIALIVSVLVSLFLFSACASILNPPASTLQDTPSATPATPNDSPNLEEVWIGWFMVETEVVPPRVALLYPHIDGNGELRITPDTWRNAVIVAPKEDSSYRIPNKTLFNEVVIWDDGKILGKFITPDCELFFEAQTMVSDMGYVPCANGVCGEMYHVGPDPNTFHHISGECKGLADIPVPYHTK